MPPDPRILIVTGAHLLAEATDRASAYRLRRAMLERLGVPAADGVLGGPVVVCSDLWYLNRDELRSRPTVSVGGPGVNALSAFLGDKLPGAFSVTGVLTVQLDPGFADRVACVWGVDHAATAAAVDAFIERYLDDFLAAATADDPPGA